MSLHPSKRGQKSCPKPKVASPPSQSPINAGDNAVSNGRQSSTSPPHNLTDEEKAQAASSSKPSQQVHFKHVV